MEEQYNRKWRYLSSYAQHKMRLRRLLQQRDEYAVLRGKASNLGTTITRGSTSDETGEIAASLLDSIERINVKIDDCCKLLSAIILYIEHADITETDKLILTSRFVKQMNSEQIYAEIDEPYRGRAAARKRIRRIVEKLPPVKG